MRDFRDAKAMAQTVRTTLAARGLKITMGESLELTAKALGLPDWNTLAAAIKSAEAEPDRSRAPSSALVADVPQARELPQSVPQPAGRMSFSPTLQATLHRAVGLAEAREHAYTTLEHLLLALIDDADAARVMRGCEADLGAVKESLAGYVDDELKSLLGDHGELRKAVIVAYGGQDLRTTPTAGLQRVIQRASIDVQSSGGHELTGADVLVGIFAERESHAAQLLRQQKMDRSDAVNFIARARQDGGRAA